MEEVEKKWAKKVDPQTAQTSFRSLGNQLKS